MVGIRRGDSAPSRDFSLDTRGPRFDAWLGPRGPTWHRRGLTKRPGAPGLRRLSEHSSHCRPIRPSRPFGRLERPNSKASYAKPAQASVRSAYCSRSQRCASASQTQSVNRRLRSGKSGSPLTKKFSRSQSSSPGHLPVHTSVADHRRGSAHSRAPPSRSADSAQRRSRCYGVGR
jgi:hypothetical protein